MSPPQARMDVAKIDGRALGIKSNPFPVGNDPAPAVGVDHLADFGQRPTQRRFRVIGHVPQQLAEPLTPVRPAGGDKKGEKRARFPGCGQHHLLAIYQNTQFTKQRDFEFGVQARLLKLKNNALPAQLTPVVQR
ncbi:hypothetical protein [Hoeflea marina]|uniref:hypothetical protein n=1 Tax=Hoeflea marina TaxID=274592 RepID=UPI001FE0203D|nr:hypothetical protein [Hoeflea marina]